MKTVITKPPLYRIYIQSEKFISGHWFQDSGNNDFYDGVRHELYELLGDIHQNNEMCSRLNPIAPLRGWPQDSKLYQSYQIDLDSGYFCNHTWYNVAELLTWWDEHKHDIITLGGVISRAMFIEYKKRGVIPTASIAVKKSILQLQRLPKDAKVTDLYSYTRWVKTQWDVTLEHQLKHFFDVLNETYSQSPNHYRILICFGYIDPYRDGINLLQRSAFDE